jgi:hypothetical protein
MVPKQKKETYLDIIMKEKKKIPSPDKYLCNVHKTNFNDMNKKSKIYMFDRKSTFKDIEKIGKKNPGVGKYNTELYDEKRNRPPKGLHKTSVERITILDEARTHGKMIPDKYNDVPLVSILIFIVLFPFSILEFHQTKTLPTNKIPSGFPSCRCF